MRPEKYGRHENSNTSENITLSSSLNAQRFGHQIYLQTVDRLGFSEGGHNMITLWTDKHCCPEPSWLDVKFSRVSLESALSNPRDAHWFTARSGWLPNVTEIDSARLQNMTNSHHSTLTQRMKKQNDLCQNSIHCNAVIILQYWF